MSGYDENAKFNEWIDNINANHTKQIDFDVEIAKEIHCLTNDDLTEKYDSKKWDYLIQEASVNESIPLILALVNCKNFGEENFKKLHDNLFDDFHELFLTSPYIPEYLIKNIMDDTIDFSKMQYFGKNYSGKVIKYLCTEFSLEKHKEYDYLAFRFFNGTNEAIIKYIEDILENKNEEYFKGDVPYSFVKNIVQNHNLPDYIRDKAFDMAYDPDNLDNMTTHMKTEYYKMCADTVFDLECIPENEQIISKVCRNAIWKPVNLPESCQLDVIDRYEKNSKTYTGNIVNNILEGTKYPSVTLYALKKLKNTKFNDAILNNINCLNDDVVKELSKITYPKHMECGIIKSIFTHTYSDEHFDAFLNFFDNPNMHRAIICSTEPTIGQINKLIMDTYLKPYAIEISYLKELRDICTKDMLLKEGQKILRDALLQFIKLDEEKTDMREMLEHFLKTEHSTQWYALTPNKYATLKRKLTDLNKHIPKFKNITDYLLEKTDKVFKDSVFIYRYPEIFHITYDEPPLNDIPYNYINETNLLNMDEKRKKEFVNDLKNVGNKYIALDIAATIYETVSDLHTFSDMQHKTFNYIYALTDIYNAAMKTYERLDFEERKPKIEDIDSDIGIR